MSIYIYPAIFTKEEKGYSINFPDIESCYTMGEDLKDGLEMAEDVLSLMLSIYEKEGKTIPKPSPIEGIKLDENQRIHLIKCDTNIE